MKAHEIIVKIIEALNKDSQATVRLYDGDTLCIESDVDDGVSALAYQKGNFGCRESLETVIEFVIENSELVLDVVQ